MGIIAGVADTIREVVATAPVGEGRDVWNEHVHYSTQGLVDGLHLILVNLVDSLDVAEAERIAKMVEVTAEEEQDILEWKRALLGEDKGRHLELVWSDQSRTEKSDVPRV